jgi:hypothetical protein
MWREGEDKPMAHRAVRLFHRCETDLQHLFATGGCFRPNWQENDPDRTRSVQSEPRSFEWQMESDG